MCHIQTFSLSVHTQHLKLEIQECSKSAVASTCTLPILKRYTKYNEIVYIHTYIIILFIIPIDGLSPPLRSTFSLISHGFLSAPCCLPSLSSPGPLSWCHVHLTSPMDLVWYVDTLPWMCSHPPVELFSAAQAMGQPSSLLGIRPRLTLSAKFFSFIYKIVMIIA